jgi:hypothetical protein
MFSHLSLAQERECIFWNAKFVAYPHLALAVRSVHLYGGPVGHLMRDMTEEEIEEYYSQCPGSFIETDAALELARRLINVVYLKISEFSSTWGERGIKVVEHFRRVTSLNITSVSFSRPGDVVWIMKRFENLKALSIWGIGFDRLDPPSSSMEPQSPICLQKVEVHNSCRATFLHWLRNRPFDLGHLHSLGLSWHYNQEAGEGFTEEFTPFLDSVAQTMEALSLKISSSSASRSRPVDPGLPDFCLRELQCLRRFGIY